MSNYYIYVCNMKVEPIKIKIMKTLKEIKKRRLLQGKGKWKNLRKRRIL